MNSAVLNFAAFLALLPAAVVSFRRQRRPDALFYAVLTLAVVGPVAWVAAQMGGPWHTGFAMALWLTIAATMALFLVLALTTRHAWQLAPLLLPYLVVLAVAALVWQSEPERPMPGAVPAGWLDAHIVFAVATYGLLTLGAVAGLAVFLQERALKAKRPTALTRLLPAVAESETLEVRLLGGSLLPFDHKTLLSLAAFVVIGGLLLARRRHGLRGRRAARLALLGYLLLTLAFLGVKFVTDVLIG